MPFQAFMRQYLRDHAHGNVSSEQFKAYYLKHFSGVAATRDIDWDTWFYSPGAADALGGASLEPHSALHVERKSALQMQSVQAFCRVWGF